MKLFSQNLNTLRTVWKLSQAELAEKFGVSSPSFGRWEDGTEPKYEVLVELSKFFKVNIDRLLTEELTPQTCPPRWGGREQSAEVAQAQDDKVGEVIETIQKEMVELRKEMAELRERQGKPPGV